LNIPPSIGNFKNLKSIKLVNCVASIPETICQLPKLRFLALPDNKNLQKLPECLADMPSLMVVNLTNVPNAESLLPESLLKRNESDDNFHFFD
jgi:hypothetical protein